MRLFVWKNNHQSLINFIIICNPGISFNTYCIIHLSLILNINILLVNKYNYSTTQIKWNKNYCMMLCGQVIELASKWYLVWGAPRGRCERTPAGWPMWWPCDPRPAHNTSIVRDYYAIPGPYAAHAEQRNQPSHNTHTDKPRPGLTQLSPHFESLPNTQLQVIIYSKRSGSIQNTWS